MLGPLKLAPGIARYGTEYASKGRWFDANLIRFLDETIRPIGGWAALTTLGLSGSPLVKGAKSAGATTITIDGGAGTLIGTLIAGDTFTVAGESGSPTHTITGGPWNTAANEITNMTFTTVIAAGGIADNAAVTVSRGAAGQVSTSPGVPRAAMAWLSATGGQAYLAIGHTHGLLLYSEGATADITPSGFTTGADDAAWTGLSTRGYGEGYYGQGPYGTVQRLQSRFQPPDVWTLDTYGSWLVGCMAQTDGDLYVYRPGTDSIAIIMTGAPTNCRSVVVTPESFVVAIGADGDPRLVQWADQTTFDPTSATCWTPTATNAAGDYTIESAGQLLCGRRGRGETLLFTDLDLTAMTYVGGTAVYAFENRGRNCGLVAPNAVARMDATFVWMGESCFFLYDGYTRELPCSVKDYVFSDFNVEAKFKAWAYVNSAAGEIVWNYPSNTVADASAECDRYVVWNYRENHWCIGQLPRACGTEAGNGFPYPIACDPDGLVYQHDYGIEHGALTPFVESGPFEVGDGERWMHILQLVPDEKTQGDVEATFYTQDYPNASETTHGPYSLANPTDLRLNARQMRVRLTETAPGEWRVGTLRLDVKAGEKR